MFKVGDRVWTGRSNGTVIGVSLGNILVVMDDGELFPDVWPQSALTLLTPPMIRTELGDLPLDSVPYKIEVIKDTCSCTTLLHGHEHDCAYVAEKST